MGALNKETRIYEYPRIAEKKNKYICPDCERDVILRKGDIRIHHFAHKKSDSPCNYYERPNESQIHKDAKMALKLFLNRGNQVKILQYCNTCHNPFADMFKCDGSGCIIDEYTFEYKNTSRRADLAYVKNNKLEYIFEICYKHRTSSEHRPEPWYEFDAENTLNYINNFDDTKCAENTIVLRCIRNITCDSCFERKCIEDYEKYLAECKRLEEEKIRQEKIMIENERINKLLQKQAEERDRIIKIRSEVGPEILKKIRENTKRCSKCRSYERCKRCVDKIHKQYNEEMRARINQENNPPSEQPPSSSPQASP